jgi:hypothetical protein
MHRERKRERERDELLLLKFFFNSLLLGLFQLLAILRAIEKNPGKERKPARNS